MHVDNLQKFKEMKRHLKLILQMHKEKYIKNNFRFYFHLSLSMMNYVQIFGNVLQLMMMMNMMKINIILLNKFNNCDNN
jgi:hypothetical protein